MPLRTLTLVALSLLTSLKASAEETATANPPAKGEVIERLVGEAEVEKLPQDNGTTFYKAGVHRVTTPLPAGYPRPTPPAVIEIKSYPEVRRATFEGQGRGPDGMKNSAGGFWPLFGHIKSRGIAMTAPVEIEYQGLEAGDKDGIEGWNMSFLYRTKDLGPKESYANIKVEDLAPLTVVATGIAGDASRESIDAALAQLEKTLADSEKWQALGDPRIMGYNGPDIPAKERWSEVQLPVEKRDGSYPPTAE